MTGRDELLAEAATMMLDAMEKYVESYIAAGWTAEQIIAWQHEIGSPAEMIVVLKTVLGMSS